MRRLSPSSLQHRMASYTSSDDSSEQVARALLRTLSFYPEEGSSDDCKVSGEEEEEKCQLEVIGVKVNPTESKDISTSSTTSSTSVPKIKFRWVSNRLTCNSSRVSLVLTSVTGTEISLEWCPHFSVYESAEVEIPTGHHSAFILVASENTEGERVIHEKDYKVDPFFVTPVNCSIQLFIQSEHSINYWQDVTPLRRRYLSVDHITPTHMEGEDKIFTKIKSVSLQELSKVALPKDFALPRREEHRERTHSSRSSRPKSSRSRTYSPNQRHSQVLLFNQSNKEFGVLEDIPSENTMSDDQGSTYKKEKNLEPGIARQKGFFITKTTTERTNIKVENTFHSTITTNTDERNYERDLETVKQETDSQIQQVKDLFSSDFEIDEFSNKETHFESVVNVPRAQLESFDTNDLISENSEENSGRKDGNRSLVEDKSEKDEDSDKRCQISLGEEGEAGPYGCVITFESRSTSLEALEEALVSMTSNGDKSLEIKRNFSDEKVHIENLVSSGIADKAHFGSKSGKIELPITPNNSTRDINQNNLSNFIKIEEVFEEKSSSYVIETSEIEDRNFVYENTSSEHDQFPIDIKGINSDDSGRKSKNIHRRVQVTKKETSTKNTSQHIKTEDQLLQEEHILQQKYSMKSGSGKLDSKKTKTFPHLPSETMDTTIESDEDMKFDTKCSFGMKSESCQNVSSENELISHSKMRSTKRFNKKGLYVVTEHISDICSCSDEQTNSSRHSKVPKEPTTSNCSSYTSNSISSSTDIDSKIERESVYEEKEDSSTIPKMRKNKKLCSHSRCKKIRKRNSLSKTGDVVVMKIGNRKKKLKNMSIQTSARLNYPSKATSTLNKTCDKETDVQSFSVTEQRSSHRGRVSYQSLPNKFPKPWVAEQKSTKFSDNINSESSSLKCEIDNFKTNFQRLRSLEDMLKELELDSPISKLYSKRSFTKAAPDYETEEPSTVFHVHTHEHLHPCHESTSPYRPNVFSSLPSSPLHRCSKPASNKTTARSVTIATPPLSYVRKTTSYEPYSTRFYRDKRDVRGDFKPYNTNTNVTINRTISLDGTSFPTSKNFQYDSFYDEYLRSTENLYEKRYEKFEKNDSTVNLLAKLRMKLQKMLYEKPHFDNRIPSVEFKPENRSRRDFFHRENRSNFNHDFRRNRSHSAVRPRTSSMKPQIYVHTCLSSSSSTSDLEGSTDSLLLTTSKLLPHYSPLETRRSSTGGGWRRKGLYRHGSVSPPSRVDPFLPTLPSDLRLNQQVKVLMKGGVKQARVVHVDATRGSISVRPHPRYHHPIVEVPFEKILLAWPS